MATRKASPTRDTFMKELDASPHFFHYFIQLFAFEGNFFFAFLWWWENIPSRFSRLPNREREKRRDLDTKKCFENARGKRAFQDKLRHVQRGRVPTVTTPWDNLKAEQSSELKILNCKRLRLLISERGEKKLKRKVSLLTHIGVDPFKINLSQNFSRTETDEAIYQRRSFRKCLFSQFEFFMAPFLPLIPNTRAVISKAFAEKLC